MQSELTATLESVGAGAQESVDVASSKGLDSPSGRYIHMPSGINHRTIRYFIPDPLSELLQRCETSAFSEPEGDSEFHAAALLHLAARRGYAGVHDQEQANLLFDFLWQAPIIKTTEDLLAIANRANERTQDIRRQIVFTGSKVASEAVHVYAPHEAVPDLMEQLMKGIQLDASDISIVDRVAVLGFFGLHAHPFRDGNGRWTRALTLATERRSLVRTIAALSFHTMCMRPLAEKVWPLARTQGLRDYLLRCDIYTDQLLSRYRKSDAYLTITGVEETMRRTAHSPLKLRSLTKSLFVNGRIEAEEAKRLLGVSSRVIGGLFHALESCGLTISRQSISIDSLMNDITEYSNASAAMALANMEGGRT